MTRLGAQHDSAPALLGTYSEQEFNTLIQEWRIATTVNDATGTVTVQRAPTAIKVGAARLLGRVCRLRLGANSAPAASTASSVAGRKVNLNQVLSQVDESEVELLNEAEVLAMYARYETLLGKGQRPATSREPTLEQLAALKSLISSHQVPCCDAIYGPHWTLIKRKLKFSGLVLNKIGELVRSELFGPSSHFKSTRLEG